MVFGRSFKVGIENASQEIIDKYLEELWGLKLGKKDSNEAYSSRWILAALSDFNGQLQARDIIRFLKYAAGQNMKKPPYDDRILMPAEIRYAVPKCSNAKISDIKAEYENLKPIFEKLEDLPTDEKTLPMNLENTRKYYATNEELIKDIGKAYQEVIKQFYDAGCRNLQLDDCTWGAVVGDAAALRYKSLGENLEDVKQQLLEVNNLALEGKPEDMVITSHICRGNYHSTFFTSGPYDTVADYVFAKENVDALFLEYDDERSGGFAPLAKVSDDKTVVLGLITTKSPVLEDKKTVIKRINEAARYIPLDRLCLSPQCGFASCGMPKEPLTPSPMTPFPLVKNKKRRIIVLQTVTLLYGVFLLAREYFIRIGVKTMKK